MKLLPMAICDVTLTHKRCGDFVPWQWKDAPKHVPRGCQTLYGPGLSEQTSQRYPRHAQLLELDPFGEETPGSGK